MRKPSSYLLVCFIYMAVLVGGVCCVEYLFPPAYTRPAAIALVAVMAILGILRAVVSLRR